MRHRIGVIVKVMIEDFINNI